MKKSSSFLKKIKKNSVFPLRQNSLLSETEDVAEESKIYLFEGGESLMAENNNLFKYFTGSIEDFLLKIKKSDNHLIKKIISPVSQRMANYLSINGINVDSSYNHVVDNYSIIHVMNGHSNIAKEQARGQIPITYKDIKMIDKVINEFDNIVVDNRKIVYAKKLPDGTVLYIEEVRRGRKELAFVSMRKMKGNIPNDLMEKMLSPENLNAWNDSAILPSDGNIPQNPENASDTDNNLRFSVAPDIDTPAFKDWFRNSKVVDQDGKPLVVYHGTNWDILSEAPGEAVVVPILLNGRSDQNRIDAHIMTSAYGKKNVFTTLVKNAIDKENNGTPSILYAQKNAESAANAEGVQFPNGFAFDSVNHNITDVGLKVKPQTETLQFKNWFKNSKVVDQDGKPLVVYHGTNWDILSEAPGEAVFDDKYRGAGSGDNGFYGRGFYFTFGNGEASKGEAGYKCCSHSGIDR